MNASYFNSQIETATRLRLALPLIDSPISLDELAAVDLAATYLKSFGLGEFNLHGDSPFVFPEFEARRERVRSGVKLLVREGVLKANESGFHMKPSNRTAEPMKEDRNQFSVEYRKAFEIALQHGPQNLLTMIFENGEEL